MVDALVSGTSVRDDVQVRVLSWAQKKNRGCIKTKFWRTPFKRVRIGKKRGIEDKDDRSLPGVNG